MSKFTNTELQLEHIFGTDKFRLLNDITWQLVHGKDDCVITVPAGYITDFDSTPWYTRSFLRTLRKGKRGFILHDFIHTHGYYWRRQYYTAFGDKWEDSVTQVLGKDHFISQPVPIFGLKMANDIMYEALRAEGMSKITAKLVKWGTASWAGKKAWKKNQPSRYTNYLKAIDNAK